MSYTEEQIHKMIDKITRLRAVGIIEIILDGNGDEIITEEYEPDFDDGDDEFYHQCHRHEDFGYRPFGCGDLL